MAVVNVLTVVIVLIATLPALARAIMPHLLATIRALRDRSV